MADTFKNEKKVHSSVFSDESNGRLRFIGGIFFHLIFCLIFFWCFAGVSIRNTANF